MLTDLDLVNLCAASYNPAAAWDYQAEVSGVWVAIRQMPDCDAVVFRGSITAEDWIRDFSALPEVADHPELGPLHAGFFAGMDDAHGWAVDRLRQGVDVVVTGHSLGAARALIFAGLVKPKRCAVFGSPKPGFQQLGDALDEAGVEVACYRNAPASGHDRVTDLPPSFPPELPWTHPGKGVDVAAEPATGDLSPFRYHHIGLYQAGVAALAR